MKYILIYGVGGSELGKVSLKAILSNVDDRDLIIVADSDDKPVNNGNYCFQQMAKQATEGELVKTEFSDRSCLILEPLSLKQRDKDKWDLLLDEIMPEEKFDLVVVIGRARVCDQYQSDLNTLVAFTKNHCEAGTRFLTVASDFIPDSLVRDLQLARPMVKISRRFKSAEMDYAPKITAAIGVSLGKKIL